MKIGNVRIVLFIICTHYPDLKPTSACAYVWMSRAISRGEATSTNFIIFGLTQPGIKPTTTIEMITITITLLRQFFEILRYETFNLLRVATVFTIKAHISIAGSMSFWTKEREINDKCKSLNYNITLFCSCCIFHIFT